MNNNDMRDSRGFRIPKVDWSSTLLNCVVALITIPFFSVCLFGTWVGCYHLFRLILSTLK